MKLEPLSVARFRYPGAATGEVRAGADDVELVLEVAELVWEPPAER